MEDIFSDLLDNIEQLHKQGLQALKEYKLKNPDWNKQQESKYKKIETTQTTTNKANHLLSGGILSLSAS